MTTKGALVLFLGSLVFAFGVFVLNLSAARPNISGAALYIQTSTGHGSGVHIGNGYIITAQHVIGADKASTILVKTDDGRILSPEIMWANQDADVALLHVAGDGIAVRQIECRDPKVGDIITTYGSPLDLTFQAFTGRISGAIAKQSILGYVQPYDITFAPGMSGGGVIDANGRLVGIARATAGGGLAIGLGVPGSTICLLMGMAR